MNKKTEQKILEEIRKRVLERDKELQKQQDTNDLRQANFEVLADMTALSRQEVDEIASQVQDEMERREAKRRKRVATTVAMISIVAVIWGLFKFFEQPKLYVEDNFDGDNNEWEIFTDYEYKRWFENGEYMFDNATDGWFYWDDIYYETGKRYSVELTTRWISGEYDDYGLMLIETYKDYISLELRADGAAGWSLTDNDKKEIDTKWSLNWGKPSDGKVRNKIRVDVDGKNFKYYVNDKFFTEGTTRGFEIKQIGVQVGQNQFVAFDDLIIRSFDGKTLGDTLLHETFDNQNSEWNAKEKYDKQSKIENGYYIFDCNKEDYCYWSSKSQILKEKNDYEITLETEWEKGETATYGLMLIQDDDNYFSFELKNDGNARFVERAWGEYSTIDDYINIGTKNTKGQKVTQKVILKDQTIEYYVNNQLISTQYNRYSDLYQVALRICGRQTVKFDKITISQL